MRAHDLIATLQPTSDSYKAAMASIKFDLGEADSVVELASAASGQFFDIPAPVCLFEYTAGNQVCWFLAHEIELGVEWRSFILLPGDGVWCCELVVLIRRDGTFDLAKEDQAGNATLISVEQLDDDQRRFFSRVNYVAHAVEVFSCCNVSQLEHRAPALINRKRIAKGKMPFFSYRTLHITPDRQARAEECLGGTHSSPRLHLRRGHVRRISDGRKIWVRPSLVGDKSKGFAAKDYEVRA